jgi:hypothetical protein
MSTSSFSSSVDALVMICTDSARAARLVVDGGGTTLRRRRLRGRGGGKKGPVAAAPAVAAPAAATEPTEDRWATLGIVPLPPLPPLLRRDPCVDPAAWLAVRGSGTADMPVKTAGGCWSCSSWTLL